MEYLRYLYILPVICFFSCYTTKMMPIKVLNNHNVLCKKYRKIETLGITVKDEKISLHGKIYNLPAGTIVDNSDFSGLIFPKETYFPVGEKLSLLKKMRNFPFYTIVLFM